MLVPTLKVPPFFSVTLVDYEMKSVGFFAILIFLNVF